MKRRNAAVMVCALVASVALLGAWLMTRDPFAITPERREALMAGAAAETEKINNLIRAQIKPATDRWAELEPKLVAFTAEYERLTGYDPLATDYVNPVEQLLVGDISRPGLEKGRDVVRSNSTDELVRLLGRADERFEVAWIFAADQPLSDQLSGSGDVLLAPVFRRLSLALAARMRLAVADGKPSEVRPLVRAAMANTRAVGGRLFVISVMMANGRAATVLGEARLLAMEGAVPVAELRGWMGEIDEGRPRWDLMTLAEAEKAFGRAETNLIEVRWADREMREREIETVRSTRGTMEVLQAVIGPKQVEVERLMPPGVTIADLKAGQAEPFQPYVDVAGPGADWVAYLVQAWAGLNAEVDATRLLLAIEVHKRVHGEYPTDLGALDLEPLGGRLPQDALAGGPFAYKRLADGGRPYELSGAKAMWGSSDAARRVYSEPRGPSLEAAEAVGDGGPAGG